MAAIDQVLNHRLKEGAGMWSYPAIRLEILADCCSDASTADKQDYEFHVSDVWITCRPCRY